LNDDNQNNDLIENEVSEFPNEIKLDPTTDTIMIKDLISKMQDILMNDSTRDSVLDFRALEGEMLIVNQKDKELFLEIRFSEKMLFGKKCYSFICDNRNHKK
jgi:hypothetical protein